MHSEEYSALRRPICTLCWSQPETVNHKARSMHNLWLPTYCKYTVLFLIDLQCTQTRHRDTVLAINLDCQILTRGIWTTCEYLPKYTVLYVLDLQCTPTRHLDNVLAVNLDSQLQTRGLYRTYDYLPKYTVLSLVHSHEKYGQCIGHQLRQQISKTKSIHSLWLPT